MPTQPPHHVSSQECQNPDSPKFIRVYPDLSGARREPVGPYYTKRTQFPPYAWGPPGFSSPKYAKRTQFPQANPQSPTAKTAKQTQCQPRRTCGRRKNTKRTQFTPRHHLPALAAGQSEFIPIHRGFIGEPNSTRRFYETNPIHHTARLLPHRRTPQKHETNPIQTDRP